MEDQPAAGVTERSCARNSMVGYSRLDTAASRYVIEVKMYFRSILESQAASGDS